MCRAIAKRWIRSTGCLFVSFTLLSAQQPSGDDLLRRVEQQLAPIQDYVVDLQVEVDMERLRIPTMKATMYFKKPDKVHFESGSFAMLPREGIAVDPTWLRERFTTTVIGTDTLNGVRTLKLQLAAKDASIRLRQLFLWVNPERWTIEKLETIPYQGRSLTVVFQYAKQDGKFWMPDTMRATFGFAVPDTTSNPFLQQYAPPMSEMPRPPRSGTVKVVYSNYRINVGLSDEIFERKK
jgi:outer membrane lipoprotein-sorting protein